MAKICIMTYGCSTNVADSEVMAGLLKKADFKIVPHAEQADLVIMNTCTVKGPTENAFYKRLKELDTAGKPVVVAGCIPQAEENLSRLEGHSLIGTYQITNIVEVVEESLNGSQVVLLKEEQNQRLLLPKVRRNPLIEIVPICSGCVGSCSYCKVKYARGKLYSYPIDTIVSHVKSALNDGVREVWLTSQDTGAYGQDIETTLPKLLREVMAIPRDFKVRLGMANPNHVLEFLDDLILMYKNPKLFKFVHIPVQSGNEDILFLMHRRYSLNDFRYIVRRFRDDIPGITLSTDIICGFPTESKKQFDDSASLIREVQPEVLNISRFWPRPGTVAAEMRQHTGSLTKQRSTEMAKIFNELAFENNKKWIGWEGEVFVDEKGKDHSWIGRTDSYRQVVIQSSESLFGETVKVKIFDVTPHDLRGKII